MNDLYVESMAAAVDRLYDEADSVTGVVVASAKKTFFAGANLNEMVKAGPADAPAVFELAERVKASLRRLETFPKPVVAAINGAALGGGFEIALACNHRVVVDGSFEVGLPEASLGLLPGGGGVTRIIRLLGIQSGLMDVLLQGSTFKPAAAKEKGLVDELVATQDELVPAAKAWIKANPDAVQNPWDAPGYKMPGGTPKSPAHGRLPAGVPGTAAQAAQGRGLPGAEGDPVGSRRGCPGRLRHRQPDRVALPDQPGRQPGLEEHDPGVLLRPAGDQRRQAPPPGHRAVEGHQGRRPRRRDDGRGHRLRLRPRRHGGRAQGRRRRERREGQDLLGEAARQGDLPRPLHRGEEGRAARPDQGHRRPGRPRGLRPGHRGGLRGPGAQAPGVRRDRVARQP